MTDVTFRDLIREAMPRWLQTGLAEKIGYAFGFALDGLGDWAAEGLKKRFPTVDNPDGLGLIGKDRRIQRGRVESDATYAGRLPSWLDNHRTRGGPYALLEQTGLFWRTPSAVEFTMYLLNWSGRRYVRNLGVTFGPQDGVVQAGPWDTDSTHWARWFLIFSWPFAISSDGLWSDPGVWDDGGVWDSNLSPNDVRDIRLVPSQWGNAHSRGYVVLLSPTAELWDTPPGLWSDPGVWGAVGQTATLSVD